MTVFGQDPVAVMSRGEFGETGGSMGNGHQSRHSSIIREDSRFERLLLTLAAGAIGMLIMLFPLIPAALLAVVYAGLSSRRRWVQKAQWTALDGRDAAVSLESAAALIVIPLTAILASVGTSWAFYILDRDLAGIAFSYCVDDSEPHCYSMTNLAAGLLVIIGAIVLAAWLALVSVGRVARHRSGAAVRAFEPDVPLDEGLRAVAEAQHMPTFPVSAISIAASEWAAQALHDTPGREVLPPPAGLFRWLLHDRFARVAMLVHILALAGQTAISLLAEFWLNINLPLHFALAATAEALLYASYVEGARLACYRYLRLARRAVVLNRRQEQSTVTAKLEAVSQHGTAGPVPHLAWIIHCEAEGATYGRSRS